MPAYPETLLTCLDKYRKDILKVDELETFQHKGGELPKGHILPMSQRALNFLPLVLVCASCSASSPLGAGCSGFGLRLP
jgi:hypothetical protein